MVVESYKAARREESLIRRESEWETSNESHVDLEQVAVLAAQFSRTDRLRLIERIVHELAAPADESEPAPANWMSLRGIAPNLLDGEDAQAWVSRTRRESDEQRDHNKRPRP